MLEVCPHGGGRIAAFTAAPMTLAPAAFGFLPSLDVPSTYLVPLRTLAAASRKVYPRSPASCFSCRLTVPAAPGCDSSGAALRRTTLGALAVRTIVAMLVLVWLNGTPRSWSSSPTSMTSTSLGIVRAAAAIRWLVTPRIGPAPDKVDAGAHRIGHPRGTSQPLPHKVGTVAVGGRRTEGAHPGRARGRTARGG